MNIKTFEDVYDTIGTQFMVHSTTEQNFFKYWMAKFSTLEQLKQKADSGSPEAEYNLSKFIINRRQSTEEVNLGFKYLLKSAQKGYIKALAVLYYLNHKALSSCVKIQSEEMFFLRNTLEISTKVDKSHEAAQFYHLVGTYYTEGLLEFTDNVKAEESLQEFTSLVDQPAIKEQEKNNGYAIPIQSSFQAVKSGVKLQDFQKKLIGIRSAFQRNKIVANFEQTQKNIIIAQSIFRNALVFQNATKNLKEYQKRVTSIQSAFQAENSIANLEQPQKNTRSIQLAFQRAQGEVSINKLSSLVQSILAQRSHAINLRELVNIQNKVAQRKNPIIMRAIQKGVQSNNAEAYFLQGIMYLVGLHVQKNKKKAFEAFEKASRLNLPIAQLQLSLLLFLKIGTKYPNNLMLSNFWLEKGLENIRQLKSSIITTPFKINGINKEQLKEFIAALQGKAQEDNILCYTIGLLFYLGLGGEVDFKKAEFWFAKCKNKVSGLANYMMADIYQKLPQEYFDKDKFLRCVNHASESKVPQAQALLGSIYAAGNLVSQDSSLAKELFLAAQKNGNSYAQLRLHIFDYYRVAEELYLDGIEQNLVDSYQTTSIYNAYPITWINKREKDLISIDVLERIISKNSCIHDYGNIFCIAIQYGKLDVVEYIYLNDASLIKRKVNTGCNSVHLASASGNLKLVQYLLKKSPDLINEKDNYGCTPLHIAAENGEIEVVKYLIKEFSNLINEKNDYGCTYLHLAAANERLEMLQAIILDKHPPYLITATDIDGATFAHIAAKYGDSKMLEYILEKCPVLTEKKDNAGLTPREVLEEYLRYHPVESCNHFRDFDFNSENFYNAMGDLDLT